MSRSASDVVGAPPPMVRDERSEDREAVGELLRHAFHRDDERDQVNRLRDAEIHGSRGLLAVRSERHAGADMSAIGIGEVVGYLRLTPARAGSDEVLVMAPLAVLPAERHHGVGTYLVQFAVEMMADQGYSAVATPYDEPFLDQFGFASAADSDVSAVGGRALRVASLGAVHVHGQVSAPETLEPLLALP